MKRQVPWSQVVFCGLLLHTCLQKILNVFEEIQREKRTIRKIEKKIFFSCNLMLLLLNYLFMLKTSAISGYFY